ncbi:S-layer homology domain-containing protein [Paenibacillus xylanexedens]|uniref:S-layer homology domain-containing protein n=1 Tax=Paenibacillus xylanexedens TaxID=528191 RepID=UPI003D064F7B
MLRSIMLGQAVQISRSGGRTLNDQAALSLNVDSADLPSGTQPAIYYYNEARQSWIFIGGKTNTAGSITANVNHLGTFIVSSYTPVNLSDLNGHWASDYADRLLGMNVIQGYTDGTFQPSKKITRAEFVTLLSKALALKSVESDLIFADQGSLSDWAKGILPQPCKPES